MKKFAKYLAVLSSAVMTLSSGIMQASAEFENKTYDTVYTYENGYEAPIRVCERVEYNGIVIKMPNDTEPTAEELGINCIIKKYDAVNYGRISDFAGESSGWMYEQTVEPEENQYQLYVTEIINEDEAIEFAKKLVIRGIAEKADVLYNHYISNGTISRDALHRNRIYVNFKNEEAAANFSFDKYPEIQEILKYTEYDSEVTDSKNVTVYGLLDTSVYQTENLSTMEIYNDVKTLNDVLTNKYAEVENVDLGFMYDLTSNESNAVYSVEPAWGDATNDDKIDLHDAIEIAKYIMGSSDLDEDTVLLADINRDGKTDIYDVIEIAKTLLS